MARQYFPENRILAHSFAMTLKFYYVYRITFCETKHFYIGCTGDLPSRLSQHMDAMLDARHNPEGHILALYAKAAEIFTEQFDKHIDNVRYIKKGLNIQVFALCDNRKHALVVEAMAINENKDNPLCLNARIPKIFDPEVAR